METIVIQSKHRPASDDSLSRLLSLTKDSNDVEDHTMWLGIENESGEIYRIVGVDGVANYVKTLRQLRDAGYWIESLEAEVPGALHAVAKAKGETQALVIFRDA